MAGSQDFVDTPASGPRSARAHRSGHSIAQLVRIRVRAPWSGAARPRVGFASTSPTTRPHRADGRVPGGRLGGGRTHAMGGRGG